MNLDAIGGRYNRVFGETLGTFILASARVERGVISTDEAFDVFMNLDIVRVLEGMLVFCQHRGYCWMEMRTR